LWLDDTGNNAYILLDVTAGVAMWTKAIGATINLDYQDSVKSIATAASAPPTEVLNDRYMLSATGTPHANWDGALNNDIVQFDGAVWRSTTPTEGMITEVEDVNTIYLYLTSWAAWQNQATTTTSAVTFAGVTLGDAGSLILPITLATDATAVGEKITATAGENLVFGDNCYLKSDGKWWKTDADAAATMPGTALAIATISANATGLFLKWGYARKDSLWTSMTVGADIYASQTGGALTQTAPTPTTTATVILQRLGKAPSSNTAAVGMIWYNPDPTIYEIGVDIIDLGTATPSTILFSAMTSIPKTWMANHSSDQTITFAAPVASDVGKRFTIVKNGTGAGKVIVDAPSGVYLHMAGSSSGDGGTAYLAASAYGSMTWMVTSATTIQLLNADGTITTT